MIDTVKSDIIHILIVEDEPAHVTAIKRSLLETDTRFEVCVASDLHGCRSQIAQQTPDIVLIDLNLPDGSALEFFRQSSADRCFPVLIMTSSGSEAQAVEALKAGALDYIVKTADAFVIMPRIVERSLREWRLQQEHQRAIDALRESELRFRTLLQDVKSVAVQGYNSDGIIHYWNRASEEIYGFSAEEALGKNLYELVIPTEIREQMQQDLHLMAATKTAASSAEYQLQRKDGSRVDVFSNHVVLAEPGRPVELYCIDIDITTHKRYEQQLEYQANHDALTGLVNRSLLKDRIDQAIHHANRSGKSVALLLLDLDRFKKVNDSLGHSRGDELLCLAAARLQQLVRETDTVARFGGDEFVILLTEVANPDDVSSLAEKILARLSDPFPVGGHKIPLSASLGISLYPLDGKDSVNLIRFADIAMYQAKKKGDQFSFFSTDMNLHILETLEMESALRQALEREEFCLHYQPKVDLKTGLIYGCEALLRWNHPKQGLVAPGTFIPLAEDTGQIVPIGTWVIREACRQIKEWHQAGLPSLSVSVNLSARQFRQGDLLQIVKRALQDNGIAPNLLELELTESMIMDDPKGAEQVLQELKNLGVGLSLDDFGTGYSSLNYLRRFPFDCLKIDQTFIRDVTIDSSGASVVASIIDIAHNLKLTAIAEGVETTGQLDFLIANGCDAMQGYLFSKPVPAGEFPPLLTRAHAVR